jgi:hypothetical protein
MLAVLALLTLRETKNKKLYFCDLVVVHALEHSRTDQIKCIVNQLQPAHVSHLVQATVLRLFAQAQLEETRYSVGMRGEGDCMIFQAKMLTIPRPLTRYLFACWLLTWCAISHFSRFQFRKL